LQPDAFTKKRTNILFEAISIIYRYATYRFINSVSSIKKKNAKLELAGGDFLSDSINSKKNIISAY
jgi:hypothetical protein